MAWKPKTPEDRMLEEYARRAGGQIYVEVPLGGAKLPGPWGKGAALRRLDGVRLVSQGEPGIFKVDKARLAQGFRDSPELIEVKRTLNRGVIGQLLAGRRMFAACYGVAPVRLTVVCSEADPALRWVCDQDEIAIELVKHQPPRLISLRDAFDNARLTAERSAEHLRKGHIKRLAKMLRDAGHRKAAEHVDTARSHYARRRYDDAAKWIGKARDLVAPEM